MLQIIHLGLKNNNNRKEMQLDRWKIVNFARCYAVKERF